MGKNVCHGFTKQHLSRIWTPQNQVVKKFWDQLSIHKKMHDVLAAILFTNPELGVWEQAKPVRIQGKMTTEPTDQQIYTLIGL